MTNIYKLLIAFLMCLRIDAADWQNLQYEPVSHVSANPLKGFIPFYDKDLDAKFPYSMEWFYLGLNEFMTGPDKFDFETFLEKKLNTIASRGNQAVFRVYLDYPGKKPAVPDFLIKNGHKLLKYKNDDPDNKGGLSPDYKDENLVNAMVNSIKALGSKYDGDPRIAFITVGYLGHWGEWHTYPNNHLMAEKTAQEKILRAFGESFKRTKFLLRYPDMGVKDVSCGFHDDSFAFATLKHPKKDWYFLSRVQKAGVQESWKSQPIGGEIYPPLQKKIWNENSPKNSESFSQCVKDSHCSWLINDEIFYGKWPQDKIERAQKASISLGYDLYISRFKYEDGTLSVEISNKGVAPFYYPWALELVNPESGNVIKTDWDITKALPEKAQIYSIKVQSPNLGLRVVNPLKGGKSLKFSNKNLKGAIVLLK